MAEERTGHRLPKKGWLKPRHSFLKNPNKIKPHSFHTYFWSSPLTSPPRAPSSAMSSCWSCAAEEQQQNWAWPIQSQCGENIAFNHMTCPSLIPLFFPTMINPHSPPCAVVLQHLPILFLLTLPDLDFSVAASHLKNWMRKKKYKRVMCLCTDGPVRGRMCCMASLEAERTRWFVGHLVFPSLWRIVKPTQELLVKTLHYPWWLYWLLGGGVVLWGLLQSTGHGSARPGVHQEGKGESFYQGLWSSGGHGPPPAQR